MSMQLLAAVASLNNCNNYPGTLAWQIAGDLWRRNRTARRRAPEVQ